MIANVTLRSYSADGDALRSVTLGVERTDGKSVNVTVAVVGENGGKEAAAKNDGRKAAKK